MKKTSVIVVLSALVLVLSVYFALSANSSHPTCGMTQRGGECYAYGVSIPCEGDSQNCEDQVCGIWSMTCPQTQIKVRLTDEYYANVIFNAEVGFEDMETYSVICYDSYSCNPICDMGKDGKGHCSAILGENGKPIVFHAFPEAGINLYGEPCGQTPPSE